MSLDHDLGQLSSSASTVELPTMLHQPDVVSYVAQGVANLYLTRLQSGQQAGRLHYIGTLEQGDFGFNFSNLGDEIEFGIIAIGGSECKVINYPLDKFVLQLGQSSLLSETVRNWYQSLYSKLIVDLAEGGSSGREASVATHVTELRIESNQHWFRSGGFLLFPGRLDIPVSDTGYFPAVDRLPVELVVEESLDYVPFDQHYDQKKFVERLQLWQSVLQQALVAALRWQENEDERRRSRRTELDGRHVNLALSSLSSVYRGEIETPEFVSDERPHLAAFHQVCSWAGIRLEQLTNLLEDPLESVRQLARDSGVPIRDVTLQGKWWAREGGPLLGFVRESGKAVALLPENGDYVYSDPINGQIRAVDAGFAEGLSSLAIMPYRTLPDRPVDGKDLLAFSFHGARHDLLRIMLFGSLGGLLGIAIPLATGLLFDSVIPSASRDQLIELSFGIVLTGLAIGVFQIVQGFSILRLESRAGHDLQNAVWYRIVNLPIEFFKQFSNGDLVQRAFGIDRIREQVSATVIRTLMSFVFSFFSLGLMFYYHVSLALWACLLILVAVVFTVTLGYLSIAATSTQQRLEGRLTAFVLQCIEGIEKIRVTGSQQRAFFHWSTPFAEKRQSVLYTQHLQSVNAVFTTTFPLLCTVVIFYLLINLDSASGLTTGTYLAFNAAFINVLSSFLLISTSLVMIFRQLPVYERMMPIMRTPTESHTGGADPGTLSGQIEVHRLRFSYDNKERDVLRDISFVAEPGEFVAVVGASGCGKSTLLRLLLGFEQPLAGSVSYDGKAIGSVDIQALRQQLGVVLQNGHLIPGDIFTNIVGSGNYTQDQAWEAARLAGLEQDIKAMPMGMNTVISESGGGLSGGQKQRLQIARAFVRKPKIMFFDEATSALDNITQKIVTQSMQKLNATRIVIAHRLSTVIDADRILVLHEGQIVESGDYKELMAKNGLFAEMAARQIA